MSIPIIFITGFGLHVPWGPLCPRKYCRWEREGGGTSGDTGATGDTVTHPLPGLTQSVPTHPGASLHLSQLNKRTHRGCDIPPDSPARDTAPGSANPTDTSRQLSQPRRSRQSPRAWNSRGAARRRPSPRLTRTGGEGCTAAGMGPGRLPASHTHAQVRHNRRDPARVPHRRPRAP